MHQGGVCVCVCKGWLVKVHSMVACAKVERPGKWTNDVGACTEGWGIGLY